MNTRSVVPIVNTPLVFMLKPIFSYVVPDETNEKERTAKIKAFLYIS